MATHQQRSSKSPLVREDADFIFHELTRSICPECKAVIDAQIIIRDNRVYMRKRCPTHGWTQALISSDAEWYVGATKYNKPGTIPLQFTTEVKDGCPLDCGLCPEHKQHVCLALVEVNSGCNLNCPVCFANAGPGFSLTMEQVEKMLDKLVDIEGQPEVVQFSGGEPTIHPQILDMVQAARDRGIKNVMINTNGVRIARDDRFLEGLAKLRPSIYFQFDGLSRETSLALRGEDLVETKIRALDRLAEIDLDVALVAAVERGVNDHEIGEVLEFALKHPAVRGMVFQPVTHVGRQIEFDPMQRITIPDVMHGIVDQSHGKFIMEDFVPVPCCFPTCQVNSYLFVNGDDVLPLPRMLQVDQYLDYITNRALPRMPSFDLIKGALEGLWSTSAVPGTERTAHLFQCACTDIVGMFPDLASILSGASGSESPDHAPNDSLLQGLVHLKKHVFQVAIKDFLDAYTFNVKQVMKCCVAVMTPDGRAIPFCAYNSVGYRESVRLESSR